MATPYKVLFDGVITKLRSSGLPNITEDQLDEILLDYIRPACIKFWACRQDLTQRDDSLGSFGFELNDKEIEILVGFMFIEFINANYINTPLLLRQSLASRDYHAFSARNHLDGLMNLTERVEKEVRQWISVYSNIGSSLFGRLKKQQGGASSVMGGL